MLVFWIIITSPLWLTVLACIGGYQQAKDKREEQANIRAIKVMMEKQGNSK